MNPELRKLRNKIAETENEAAIMGKHPLEIADVILQEITNAGWSLTQRNGIEAAAIRSAWEDCKQHGLNKETIHFMDNALDAAGY